MPDSPVAPETTDGAAPATDTPTADGQDTAQRNTPQNPVDWEARYKAAQAELTRKAQRLSEAEGHLQELMSAAEEPDEDELEGDEPPATPTRRVGRRENAEAAAWRQRYEEEAWARAESVWGPEVIAAYATSQQMMSRAETPADYIAALEAYHAARSQGASPAAAAAAAEPQADNPEPRVDPNRTDAGPAPSQIDPRQFEAGKNGGARGYFTALLEQRNS